MRTTASQSATPALDTNTTSAEAVSDTRQSILIIGESDPLYTALDSAFSRASKEQNPGGVAFDIAGQSSGILVRRVHNEGRSQFFVSAYGTEDGKLAIRDLEHATLLNPVPEHYLLTPDKPLTSILQKHALAYRGSYPDVPCTIELTDEAGNWHTFEGRLEVSLDTPGALHVNSAAAKLPVDLRRDDLTVSSIEVLGAGRNPEHSELRLYYRSYERPESPLHKPEQYANRILQLTVEQKDEPGNPYPIGPVKINSVDGGKLILDNIQTPRTARLNSEYHSITKAELADMGDTIPGLFSSAAAAGAYMQEHGLRERPDYQPGEQNAVEHCGEHFYPGLPVSVRAELPSSRAFRHSSPDAPDTIIREFSGTFIEAGYNEDLRGTYLVLKEADNLRRYIPMENILSAVPQRFAEDDKTVLYEAHPKTD